MERVPFIDVHCHLDLCQDIEGCVRRARERDVRVIITQGVNLESNRKALELALAHPEVKAALGLYPLDALRMSDGEIDEEIAFIRRKKELIAAIGEVGMDFKEDTQQHERQQKIFEKMIMLAQEMDKPLIVHSRKAEKECIEMIEKMKSRKVIMHCFSGKLSLVKRIAERGWFLSVPTNVTYSQQFQAMAREVPLTQLLCESDAPYLHPQKQKNNEPANVVESYKTISLLKGIPLEDVKEVIGKNYRRAFFY